MPTPRSPQYQAMLDVLADGRWHDRDELLAAGEQKVSPGRAFRMGERNRRRRGAGAERTRGDDNTSIRSGAREVARRSLFRAAQSRKIERDGARYRLVKR